MHGRPTSKELVGALGIEEGDARVHTDKRRDTPDHALDHDCLGDADVGIGRGRVPVQRRQRHLVKVDDAHALHSVARQHDRRVAACQADHARNAHG